MPPIRHIIAAIAILAAATAQGQTVKTLGFDTTNNTVVGPTNTNALVFTNALDVPALSTGGAITAYSISLTGETTDLQAFGQSLGIVYASEDVKAWSFGLYDLANTTNALSVTDSDISVAADMLRTNAPVNMTNAVRWMNVISGTNVYKLPLYQ